MDKLDFENKNQKTESKGGVHEPDAEFSRSFTTQNFIIRFWKNRNKKNEEKLFISISDSDGKILNQQIFSCEFFETAPGVGIFRSFIQKYIPDFDAHKFLVEHNEEIRKLANTELPPPAQQTIQQPEFSMSEGERKEALDILEHGNPLDLILNTMDKVHKKDEALKVLLALSPLTLKIKCGEIHVMIVGRSGKGKKISNKMLNILPKYCYESWAAMSPQTLKYYAEVNEPRPMIHHIDEAKVLGDGIALIRSLTSGKDFGGTPTKCGVVKDQQYLEINITEPVILWLNCARPIEDEDQQLPNRFVIANVDETKEQDELVHLFQIETIGSGHECISPEVDFKKIQNLYHILLEDEDNVVIPFLGHINFNRIEDRRQFPTFTRLIKASAKLYKIQRMRTESGEIVASYADYVVARYIWDTIFETQTLKVNKTAVKILESIPMDKPDAISRSKLSERTGIPTSTIRNILEGQLLPPGLVNSSKTKNKFIYWRSEGAENLQTCKESAISLLPDKITPDNLFAIKTDVLKNLQDLQPSKEQRVYLSNFDIDHYFEIYISNLSNIPCNFASSVPEFKELIDTLSGGNLDVKEEVAGNLQLAGSGTEHLLHRQKVQTITDLIRQGLSDKEGILYEAANKDISQEETEQILAELKSKGNISEPKAGLYLIVNPATFGGAIEK